MPDRKSSLEMVGSLCLNLVTLLFMVVLGVERQML